MKINFKQLDDIKLKKYKAVAVDLNLLSITYNKLPFVILFRTSIKKKEIVKFLEGEGAFELKKELIFKRADKIVDYIKEYSIATNNKVMTISKDKG